MDQKVETADPRLVQASVARLFSHVFMAAVMEAQELYAQHPEDAAADRLLVSDFDTFQQGTQDAIAWTRAFVYGLTIALNHLRNQRIVEIEIQDVVSVYCEHDPQKMERVAVGIAMFQALQHIQTPLNTAFPNIDAAGMLADWLAGDGQTDAGIAWLLDTTAHLLVADAIPVEAA